MESDPLSLERIAKTSKDVAQNIGRVNGLTTVEVEDKMRAGITILAALALAERFRKAYRFNVYGGEGGGSEYKVEENGRWIRLTDLEEPK